MEEYHGYPYYSFVQTFEEQFDHEKVQLWMKDNCHISVYIAVAYLAIILSLKEWMKNRKAMKIRNVVKVWNFAVAAFSTCGMFRGLPEITYVVLNYGLEFSMCNSNGNNVSFFWVWAFVFSKAVELFDTVILILMKKELTILHVSHHVLTMIISWYYCVGYPGGGRWIICINYTIHSVMYTYFALKSVKIEIPQKISMLLTLAQIAQFCLLFIGNIFAIRANINGRPCTTTSLSAFLINFYLIFLIIMFVNFFVRRYKFVKND